LIFSIGLFTNRFVCPPTSSGGDKVHLLETSAFWIGDRRGVFVSDFFDQAIGTGMFVGNIEAARPTVIAVSREASLGTWRVLVGGNARPAFILVVMVVAEAVGLVARLQFFDEGSLVLELLVFGLGWRLVGHCDVIGLGGGQSQAHFADAFGESGDLVLRAVVDGNEVGDVGLGGFDAGLDHGVCW
jgi:hypothetical protein